MDKMTGQERVRRALSLYEHVHMCLEHQGKQADPNASDRAVRLRVARILYITDQRTLALLDMIEAD